MRERERASERERERERPKERETEREREPEREITRNNTACVCESHTPQHVMQQSIVPIFMT